MTAARESRPRAPEMEFRSELRPEDVRSVREIVSSSGFFNAAEVEVAVELAQERLAKGAASGYHFLLPEGAHAHAYACYGPVPATQGSFDLYWIAVHDSQRGRGLGRRLLAAVERAVAAGGGLRIWVETSSRALYEPTRAFYRACGYDEVACLRDFYAAGDSKVIFCKCL